jgi:hypothetical protein
MLGALAAGCSSGGGPREGWLVEIPGGGYVRTFAPFEPLASGCEGRSDGEVAFFADAIGSANDEIGEAAAIALKGGHESLDAFGEAAKRRFNCGVSGFAVAASWLEGEAQPCDSTGANVAEGVWREERRNGRRLKWMDAYTYRGGLTTSCVVHRGVRLLWEADNAPLRISVWVRNSAGGREAALRRAEGLAATYTPTAPG